MPLSVLRDRLPPTISFPSSSSCFVFFLFPLLSAFIPGSLFPLLLLSSSVSPFFRHFLPVFFWPVSLLVGGEHLKSLLRCTLSATLMNHSLLHLFSHFLPLSSIVVFLYIPVSLCGASPCSPPPPSSSPHIVRLAALSSPPSQPCCCHTVVFLSPVTEAGCLILKKVPYSHKKQMVLFLHYMNDTG